MSLRRIPNFMDQYFSLCKRVKLSKVAPPFLPALLCDGKSKNLGTEFCNKIRDFGKIRGSMELGSGSTIIWKYGDRAHIFQNIPIYRSVRKRCVVRP